MSNIVLNNEFKAWVSNISEKYKQAQIKAAISVNSEMLKFYFELGKEISNNSFKATYGSRFYDSLSGELISNLPNVKGLSIINLRYMEKFYNLYKDNIQIVPQLVEELFSIPWGHHRYIIDKCKDVDKALFFVRKVHENNWSRDVLLNFISTDLYEREGKAINNFELALPDTNKDLAKQITKDPYNFDFLAITNEYNEKELKDALVENIQKFLLTKTQTKSAFYGLNELRYYGEYSTHMYGWYLSFWAHNKKIPLFSSLAESSNEVDIRPYEWEGGKNFWRNIFYLIFGWLGV